MLIYITITLISIICILIGYYTFQRIQSKTKFALHNLAKQLAHDIQSPLAVIEITAQGMQRTMDTAHHKILLQAAQNIRDLTSNLLAQYQRPESKIPRITKPQIGQY